MFVDFTDGGLAAKALRVGDGGVAEASIPGGIKHTATVALEAMTVR